MATVSFNSDLFQENCAVVARNIFPKRDLRELQSARAGEPTPEKSAFRKLARSPTIRLFEFRLGRNSQFPESPFIMTWRMRSARTFHPSGSDPRFNEIAV
jgi:hypothetical protein